MDGPALQTRDFPISTSLPGNSCDFFSKICKTIFTTKHARSVRPASIEDEEKLAHQ
jgi:hypothetical protein